MDLNGKRLVVIGGAGLIGSHTVEALLREDVGEVVIYDNFVRGSEANLAEALEDPRVRVFEAGGDICQTDILGDALAGADGVFHFAALWLLQCHEYPRAAFDVNIRGTFNVLEACIANDVSRLVYSSSASVYGDAVEEPMTEDHPFNFENFYGATKVAGEAMARSLHARYGLDYVGLRYMNVYGPRQDYHGAYIAVIMKMLDSIDRGEPLVIYGDGSQAYDFVYVGDCAEANVAAMKAETTNRFYNVGTGIRTSIRELAEMVLELTGSDVGIRFEPAGLTFVKNRIGSPDRAAEEIGFRAKVDLEDGMRELIEWRREHKAQVDRARATAAAR
jgi:UDP-glucose 4-epimerase